MEGTSRITVIDKDYENKEVRKMAPEMSEYEKEMRKIRGDYVDTLYGDVLESNLHAENMMNNCNLEEFMHKNTDKLPESIIKYGDKTGIVRDTVAADIMANSTDTILVRKDIVENGEIKTVLERVPISSYMDSDVGTQTKKLSVLLKNQIVSADPKAANYKEIKAKNGNNFDMLYNKYMQENYCEQEILENGSFEIDVHNANKLNMQSNQLQMRSKNDVIVKGNGAGNGKKIDTFYSHKLQSEFHDESLMKEFEMGGARTKTSKPVNNYKSLQIQTNKNGSWNRFTN